MPARCEKCARRSDRWPPADGDPGYFAQEGRGTTLAERVAARDAFERARGRRAPGSDRAAGLQLGRRGRDTLRARSRSGPLQPDRSPRMGHPPRTAHLARGLRRRPRSRRSGAEPGPGDQAGWSSPGRSRDRSGGGAAGGRRAHADPVEHRPRDPPRRPHRARAHRQHGDRRRARHPARSPAGGGARCRGHADRLSSGGTGPLRRHRPGACQVSAVDRQPDHPHPPADARAPGPRTPGRRLPGRARSAGSCGRAGRPGRPARSRAGPAPRGERRGSRQT